MDMEVDKIRLDNSWLDIDETSAQPEDSNSGSKFSLVDDPSLSEDRDYPYFSPGVSGPFEGSSPGFRRLFTSIHEEARRHSEILKTLSKQGDPILGIVDQYCLRRKRANSSLHNNFDSCFQEMASQRLEEDPPPANRADERDHALRE